HSFLCTLRRSSLATLFPYTTLFRSTSLTNEMPYEPIPGKMGAYILRGTEDAEKFLYDQISGALITGVKSATVTQSASHLGFDPVDRKSTRLNSSHVKISYAVFCLKK